MEIVILHWFESMHVNVLNYFFYFMTLLGDKGIFWIVIALLMLLVLPKHYRKVGFAMAIALILSVIFCNLILKHAFERSRPFWIDDSFENLFGYFDTIDDYSFPSGHASASVAAAVAIRMWKTWEGNVAIIVAALISFSRIYLTVHYPSDVIVSCAMGVVFGIASYYITKAILDKFPRLRPAFKGNQSYKTIFKPELVKKEITAE